MAANLEGLIRTIPDYPTPGIMFRDITPLLGDAVGLEEAVSELSDPFYPTGKNGDRLVDKVAGIEARGFILGGAVAIDCRAGFIPVRKKGKLPSATIFEQYELEYGTDELHMHDDAVAPGERIYVIDDLIATGGTALATIRLLRRSGANVVGFGAVIDLPDLGGSERIRAEGIDVYTLMSFEGH
jgi:adenine phosphoribosyltransferase